MQLSEQQVDEQRRRLGGRAGRVTQGGSGLGALGGFLFGSIFVAAGTAITLIGLKVIPVDDSDVHAPYWLIALIGSVFAGAGCMVWAMSLRAWLLSRKKAAAMAQHPDEPVFKDFPWDPRGEAKGLWGPVLKALMGTIFLGVFLVPFNWWAWFSREGPLMVKIIVSLFDLFLVAALWGFFHSVMVAMRYGSTRLEYPDFPCRTGGTVTLHWFPPNGIAGADKLTFVLRCVEEWTETRGSGKNRSTVTFHEQLWGATRVSSGRINCTPGRPLDLEFDIPAGAPGSKLTSADKVRFWELDVKAEAPGVDFAEHYLVPIYEPREN